MFGKQFVKLTIILKMDNRDDNSAIAISYNWVTKKSIKKEKNPPVKCN